MTANGLIGGLVLRVSSIIIIVIIISFTAPCWVQKLKKQSDPSQNESSRLVLPGTIRRMRAAGVATKQICSVAHSLGKH